MAKARRFLLTLLSALLLLSQHAAITHALWHQTRESAQLVSVDSRPAPGDDRSQAARLCDFDAMLGQILAGGAVATPVSVPIADDTPLFLSEASRLAALTRLQPRSRGPPIFL